MFFGEQAFRINANPFNDQEESGRDIEEICRTELETLNFVGFDFQKAGYRSLFTEDWALGVVSKFFKIHTCLFNNYIFRLA